MCVQSKNSGFVFECGYYGEFVDIEEAILQEDVDNEQPVQEVELEIKEDYTSKLLRVLSISIPYSFICESTVRITDKNVCYVIILSSLIYGMIITINQCHNRHTKYYWVFVTICCFVAPPHCTLLMFVVPYVIEYYFKPDNIFISFLEDKYGKLWGNHVYWCLVSWFWFIFIELMFDFLKNKITIL
jgi:hypothetical protein